MHSEILAPLLGCHQKLLLDVLRRGWPFSLEAELEMADDLIDGCGIFDEGNDLHLAATSGALRVNFISFHRRLFRLSWEFF